MEVEANFTLKVAYLKFQEQLKRKSGEAARLNVTESRQPELPVDDIFLQPNFEKHTNLFLDFKHQAFQAALRRHGISLQTFEELCSSAPELQDDFNQRIHFPFIGLVREKGPTSFEGAAVLARPPSLKISVA